MGTHREHWGSKLGIILAVAGSAVGLGNFLRFPVKAALFGGGAFLIPYFVALLLLGIPLAWVEWSMGRYGGQYSHGSGPGIFNAIVRRPWAKYLGSLGVFGPTLIFFYYVYIESWLLGFAWYSLTGELMAQVTAGTVKEFFGAYISLSTSVGGIMPAALFFFLITFAVNFAVLYMGIRRGIELVNKVAIPLCLLLGLVLLVRVLTVPGIESGLAFMWNPDYSRLLEPKVWLEAAGQIFFTLSVGIGTILTYASYMKRNQDVALSSVSACAANEFAEVILGGTIVIPMALVVYGAANIEEVAKMGTFGLGFNTMPVIFGKMAFAQFFQTIWFTLLFIAGITSSISVLQPALSFCEDEFGLSRKRSSAAVGVVALLMGLVAVFGLNAGAVDEMDFWGGTFALVVFGTIEAILFGWVFGIERGWDELQRGAHIRIPRIYRFIIKYVTPTYLLIVLGAWLYTDGVSVVLLKGVDPAEMVQFAGITMSKVHVITGVRLLLLSLLIGVNVAIYLAWKCRKLNSKLELVKEAANA